MEVSTKKIQGDFVDAIKLIKSVNYIFLNLELLSKIFYKIYSFRDISDPIFFLYPVYTHTYTINI